MGMGNVPSCPESGMGWLSVAQSLVLAEAAPGVASPLGFWQC